MANTDFTYYEDTVCELPIVKTNFSLRFTNSAHAYIRVSNESYQHAFYAKDSSGDIHSVSRTQLEGEKLLSITDLELNNYYTLYTQDNCGDTIPLSHISTHKFDTSTIMVSDALMRLIIQQDSTTSLYSLFNNDSTILFEEKFNFVQEYFFKDSALDISNFNSSIYPVNNDILEDRCYCQVVQSTIDFAPGYPNFTNPRTPPAGYPEITNPFGNNGYISSHDYENTEYWKPNDEIRGFYYNNIYLKGAAKHMDNYSVGTEIHSRYSEFIYGLDDDQNSAPSYAGINFLWYCTEGTHGDLDDCGCEQEVYYEAEYNVRLQAKTDLPNCTLCGNDGARAKAEEYAVLSLSDYDDNFNILAAGRGTVSSEKDKSYNVEWFTSLADIAVTTYFTITGSGVGLTQSIIDDLIDDIETVLTTPIKLISTSPEKDESSALIQKDNHFDLYPNEPTKLLLQSYSTTESSGHTSWESQARIISDFKLSTAVHKGIPEGEDQECCSDGVGSWVLTSFPLSPVNAQAHKFNVGSFLGLFFLSYDGTSFGVNWESGDCTYDDNVQTRENLNLEKSRNSWLPIKYDEITNYKIYDLRGMVVTFKSGITVGNEKVIDIINPAFPGMYIINFNTDEGNRVVSKKIFVAEESTGHFNKVKITTDE